jgi:hypothetical protein
MFAIATSFLAVWTVAHAAPSATTAPTVTIRNGTYTGVHGTTYGQDLFLGIPYAQQPVGNLRFTVPQSLNESWDGARDAKEYSDICVGYGVSEGFLSLQLHSSDFKIDRLHLVPPVRSLSHPERHPRRVRQGELQATGRSLDSWWWLLHGIWER